MSSLPYLVTSKLTITGATSRKDPSPLRSMALGHRIFFISLDLLHIDHLVGKRLPHNPVIPNLLQNGRPPRCCRTAHGAPPRIAQCRRFTVKSVTVISVTVASISSLVRLGLPVLPHLVYQRRPPTRCRSPARRIIRLRPILPTVPSLRRLGGLPPRFGQTTEGRPAQQPTKFLIEEQRRFSS